MPDTLTARSPTCDQLLGPLSAAMSEGVAIVDLAGHISQCNPAAQRILGLTHEQMGRRVPIDSRWQVISEDGSRIAIEDLPALYTLRTGLARRGVVMGIVRGDGEHVWLLVNSQPLRNPEGHLEAVLTTFTDITGLRRAETALRESEARFRTMADHAPMPIWLADMNGRREFFNRCWHEFTGVTNFGADGADWAALVHPEDLPALEQALADGRLKQMPVSVEYRLRHREGTHHWLLEQATPRFDQSGRLMGFVGMAMDIDARRQSEDTIRKLSRALDQSDTRIVITDDQGRIEYINSACCKAYGYSAEELIGKNPRMFKSGQTPPQIYEGLWRTLMSGETWRGELTNRTRNGKLVLESVTISPVRDERGRTRHYVALKEDIGEQRAASIAQRELDARLARLERMRTVNTLAGGVAHDFNNILVAILGFSDLGARLLRNGGDSSRVISYLEEIRSAGERARTLVRQLLAFGRAGDVKLARVNLAELLHDTLTLLEVSLPQHVALEPEIAEDLPAIAIDGAALQQVLVNLCLNARDAMPDGGPIRVVARLESVREACTCASCHRSFSGEFLCIEVADQGSGIAEELRSHLFEPFFTTKELGLGSGMGLPVVHGTVHQYEGHLRLESTPGAGTRVAIYLPLAAIAAEAAA